MVNLVITGANFFNRGAELMLLAALAEVRSWPEITSISLPVKTGSPEQRRQLGLDDFIARKIDRSSMLEALLSRTADLVPSWWSQRAGWVRPRDISVVLDASGYVYADRPGLFPKRSLQLYRKLASGGARIVLLPQAIGPFESDEGHAAFREIVQRSTLVFARDEESLRHAREAAPGAGLRIDLAPDFTIGLPADPSRIADLIRGRACLIPNMRMLRDTNREVATWYLDTMARVTAHLRMIGLEPFAVLHQQSDMGVVESLRASTAGELEVIHVDATSLKGVLGASRVVVGSRYHGIVSALSLQVPAVGIGWSHKYRELFRDFEVPELMAENGTNASQITDLLDDLVSGPARDSVIYRLDTAARRMRLRTERMWRSIRDHVFGGDAPR